MQYTYKIIYSYHHDARDWYLGLFGKSFNSSWPKVPPDKYKEFKKLVDGFSEEEAVSNFVVYLKQKKRDAEIEEAKDFFSQEYSKKFNIACEWLEKTTKRELAIKNFTIFLTTSPRAPYNYQRGYLWCYFKEKDPIENFLHEVLHFQFHYYWQDDSSSPVSKLTERDFNILKESLTVILDESLIPLIKSPDVGYASHQELRKLLHRYWIRYRDFDKLVDYGLKKLPGFTS
jgi:hypothetical protein